MTLGRLPHHGDVTPSSDGAPTMAADMRRAGEVLLFVVDAGGGHRAAARALLAAAEETGFPLRLRAVSLQEVLAPQDVLKRFFGLSIEDFYNLLLRRTLHRRCSSRCCGSCIGSSPCAAAPWCGAWCRSSRHAGPRAVVSVIPNFNGVIRDAVREAAPGAPFLVLLTDLADLPPHFWIEPGVDGVIVGTDEAVAQARALGLPEERIHRVSGMPLAPALLRRGGRRADLRARVRAELRHRRPGPSPPCCSFGGKGSAEIEPLTAGAPGRRPGTARHRGVRRQPAPARGSRPPGRGRRGAGSTPSDSPTASPTTWRPATCS